MNSENEKCVMIINDQLPAGFIANTAAIMGITLGKAFPQVIGPNVIDKNGFEHLGIITIPVPVLKANEDKIGEIRKTLYDKQFNDVTVVDFSQVAQRCNIYDEFIKAAANASIDDFQYYGIALYGPKKLVNKLTGSLPLLK